MHVIDHETFQIDITRLVAADLDLWIFNLAENSLSGRINQCEHAHDWVWLLKKFVAYISLLKFNGHEWLVKIIKK